MPSAQQNKTETKQFQNCFETVLYFVSAKTKLSRRETFSAV